MKYRPINQTCKTWKAQYSSCCQGQLEGHCLPLWSWKSLCELKSCFSGLVALLMCWASGPCNKTNPIFELLTFFRSFCLPYRFPFVVTWLSGSCQALWTATTLLCTWPRAHSHECQFHHVTVSLTLYLPFTLLTTHSQLLLCYSTLPLTSILTPQCSLHFSLFCHLYLLPHSLYYNLLPYQSFPLHDLLSYQATVATVLTTLTTHFSPYTLIMLTFCITHLYN